MPRHEDVAVWAAQQAKTSSPGVVFVRRKAKAEQLAAAIENVLGEPVPWVTSDVPQHKRDAYVEQLRSGKTAVAVATSAWSTGLDIPELRWVAFADEGKAPIWVTQAAVRGSRVAEGKTEFEVFDLQCKDSAVRREHLSDYIEDTDALEQVQLARKASDNYNNTDSTEPRYWLMGLILMLSFWVTCH